MTGLSLKHQDLPKSGWSASLRMHLPSGEGMAKAPGVGRLMGPPPPKVRTEDWSSMYTKTDPSIRMCLVVQQGLDYFYPPH
jgi:hypothetical protein